MDSLLSNVKYELVRKRPHKECGERAEKDIRESMEKFKLLQILKQKLIDVPPHKEVRNDSGIGTRKVCFYGGDEFHVDTLLKTSVERSVFWQVTFLILV